MVAVCEMEKRCEKCNGTGLSAKMRTVREVLEVFVEKGTPNGHKIVVHGKADEAPGSEAGDVVVVVREQVRVQGCGVGGEWQDHPKFMRKEVGAPILFRGSGALGGPLLLRGPELIGGALRIQATSNFASFVVHVVHFVEVLSS